MSGYVKDLGSATRIVNDTACPATLSGTPSPLNTVVLITMNTSTQTLSSVADTQGNTWVVDVTSTFNGIGNKETVCIAHTLQNVAPLVSGNTVSPTLSAANTDKVSILLEILGQGGVDKTKTNNAVATTALTTTATTATVQTNELALAAFASGGNIASWTADANSLLPTLNLKNSAGGTPRTLLVEYRDLVTPAAQTATGTQASNTFAAAIATFIVPHIQKASASNFQDPASV